MDDFTKLLVFIFAVLTAVLFGVMPLDHYLTTQRMERMYQLQAQGCPK
jgi:hypothetical protein